ncbi:1-aminocyclopropane-1-carboxylate deaminase/D-cysteine desulfhydrase [Phytohabitans houttuyneae]|uniref:1-aminocyclopropane-1-carboxylate deaminase/D-cysteine desulfhydrase n=1 Tax=Phytohabitans houttuyneae TaxID=1076126 RepID=UPI00353061FC
MAQAEVQPRRRARAGTPDAAYVRRRTLQPHPRGRRRRPLLRLCHHRGHPWRRAPAAQPDPGLRHRSRHAPALPGPHDVSGEDVATGHRGAAAHAGDFYLVPEGGSNALALRGCAELPGEIPFAFDHICCPTGTGGTLAGIALGLAGEQRAIGFSALKGGAFLAGGVRRLQAEYGRVTDNWSVETDHHFGGYARRNAELDDFARDFEERHAMPLDWVYVAKMLYGVFALVRAGRFPPGSVVVAVITGSGQFEDPHRPAHAI